MGPEKKVEEQIKNDLLNRGAYMFKHHASGHNKKGIPDIHAVYAGFAVFVEVKAPKTGVVSVQQKKHIKSISDNGGVGIISSDPSFVSSVLDMLRDGVRLTTNEPTPYINCNQVEEPKVYSDLQFEGVWGTILKEKEGVSNVSS